MKNHAPLSPKACVPKEPSAISRRRCLALFASATAVPLSGAMSAQASAADTRTWTGEALGGDVSITLEGFSPAASERLINRAVAALDGLEDVFSLYRPASALAKLNRDGRYTEAPRELTDALAICRDLYERSDGAFDPSVQRLWTYYDAGSREKEFGPSTKSDFSEALASVDFDRVKVSTNGIALPRGMSLTLNGIAQGIATDKVAGLFRDAGARHTLINLGEFRALAPKSDGSSWQIGLRDPAAIWRLTDVVQLREGALATSAGSGHRFRHGHHLLDPKSGRSASHYKSVSVVAPTATLADGLSTALYVLPLEKAQQLVAQYENVGARFSLSDGRNIDTERWRRLLA